MHIPTNIGRALPFIWAKWGSEPLKGMREQQCPQRGEWPQGEPTVENSRQTSIIQELKPGYGRRGTFDQHFNLLKFNKLCALTGPGSFLGCSSTSHLLF